jgi:hypothetical protein
MPRPCTVCNHPDRDSINKSLMESAPYRAIAVRTGTSTGALQRHKNERLPVSEAALGFESATPGTEASGGKAKNG